MNYILLIPCLNIENPYKPISEQLISLLMPPFLLVYKQKRTFFTQIPTHKQYPMQILFYLKRPQFYISYQGQFEEASKYYVDEHIEMMLKGGEFQQLQNVLIYMHIVIEVDAVIRIEQIGLQLNYFEAKKMAFIIQQLHQLTSQNAFPNQLHSNKQGSIHQTIANHFSSIQQKFMKNGTKHENYSCVMDPVAKTIVIRFIRAKNYRKIILLYTININYETNLLKISAKIMNKKQTFAKIQGSLRQRLLIKSTYIRSSFEVESKISINMLTGQLKLDSPFYYVQKSPQRNIDALIQFFTKLYSLNMQELDRKMLYLFFIMDQQYGCSNQETKIQLWEQKTKQIFRFSGLLNIYLNLTSETLNQQQDLILNLYKQAESYRRLQANRVQIGNSFKNISLYEPLTPHSADNNTLEQQPLNFLQRQYFQKRLELPLNQRCEKPHQNFYVLNYIKLSKKIPQGNLRKIKKGGFTTIYLSQIEYWYVGSYCAGQKQMLQLETNSLNSPPLKKHIIIKREDRNVNRQYGKSRVAHEILILTKIKCGLSMFLPKFYLLAEKDDIYSKDLLVDFINSPNLSDYIEINRHILSLNTKLYTILMIGQGLRYLKQYKIAHLDLKPTNIMTFKKLTFKLIDFGESYHPSIKGHHPGFSSPYSAPQNYSIRQSYNHKNDVFSLGIIMYELLIGKYPFYFYDDKLKDKVYTHGNYLNHWFQLPEEMLMYGDTLICPIIYYIMRKCLHADPDQRPELEWIVIIFRECLDYFN